MSAVEAANEGRAAPRPAWLRKPVNRTATALDTERRVDRLGLHTVCRSARCPNIGECFAAGTATFLILGDRCTRGCAFCAVDHSGELERPDPAEGARIAEFMRAGGIRYAVVTSVTRDDLPDGGASHFVSVTGAVKAALPDCRLEVLVPDFGGRAESVREVCAAPIDVFGHNVETVEGLYPRVRPGASYARSLGVLVAARATGRLTKTGVMVGVGESRAEIAALFRDLAAAGVEILTVGQYLRPGSANLPVHRYYRPEEFDDLRAEAVASGIPTVVSGPYVRSSYLAEAGFRQAEASRGLLATGSGEKGV
jgi:lipoyl synthase